MMSSVLATLLASNVLSQAALPKSLGEVAKPAAAAEAVAKRTLTPVGEVTGTIVKVDATSLTIKAPELVQKGTTRKHVGPAHHKTTITEPKLGVKQVTTTYPLDGKLSIKTIGGKAVEQDALKPGGAIRIHVSQATEKTTGQPAETRLVIASIDVPNALAAPAPAPKK